MPGCALVVMLQRIALWETGEVDWSEAHWGFPLNQYTCGKHKQNLHTVHIACVYIEHTTYSFLQQLGLFSCAVCKQSASVEGRRTRLATGVEPQVQHAEF